MYTLYLKTLPLATFNLDPSTKEIIDIKLVNENIGCLPLYTKQNIHGLEMWLNNRYKFNFIVSHPADTRDNLSKAAMKLIYTLKNKGLSLVDHYWIGDDRSGDTAELYHSINTFSNIFDDSIAVKWLEETKRNNSTVKADIFGRPRIEKVKGLNADFSLQGIQRKAGLSKKNSSSGRNSIIKKGTYQAVIEPISSIVNKTLGIDHIYYDKKFVSQGISCSDIFLGEHENLVTLKDLAFSNKFSDVRTFAEFFKGIDELPYYFTMILSDAVCGNKDRHSNNIHFKYNLDTGEIVPYPLFDYGEFFLIGDAISYVEQNIEEWSPILFEEIAHIHYYPYEYKYHPYSDYMFYTDCQKIVKMYNFEDRLRLLIDNEEIKEILDVGYQSALISEREGRIIKLWIDSITQSLAEGKIKNEFAHDWVYNLYKIFRS